MSPTVAFYLGFWLAGWMVMSRIAWAHNLQEPWWCRLGYVTMLLFLWLPSMLFYQKG